MRALLGGPNSAPYPPAPAINSAVAIAGPQRCQRVAVGGAGSSVRLAMRTPTEATRAPTTAPPTAMPTHCSTSRSNWLLNGSATVKPNSVALKSSSEPVSNASTTSAAVTHAARRDASRRAIRRTSDTIVTMPNAATSSPSNALE